MAKYLSFILILLFSCGTTNVAIEHAYNRAKTKLNPELKDVLSKHEELLASEGNGPAIFLKNKIDTIEAVNGSEVFSESGQLDQDIWIAATEYNGTELKISIGTLGNQFIEHKVHNQKISTEFSEDYKDDDLVKLKKEDQPSNELLIPLAIAEIELSKTANFKVGELIYGKVRLVTQPYYLQTLGYKFDYIKREYEYYFKCKIRGTRK